ncbi:hypothetical protein SAMN05421504_11151 [Amycolatopsis xylanica]|uniref:LPXTG-motif cell wall anchor domain-containing protein n=1 Tax=Amycolatopsis xylanica TaxID=589385 RepID=A0A1H3RGA7_9PSEU|nr:hypothetical protein [Amycolatopsis xylanica]SDZ24261.1 hypothetical protein SAMN05421504_11151 [Amycolatopsis xylanica]
MIRKSVVVAGAAAGFALLSPVAALAGNAPLHQESLSVSISGSTVTLHATCAKPNEEAEGMYGQHVELGAGVIERAPMKADGYKQTVSFKNLKPGKYYALALCGSDTGGKGPAVDFTMPAPAKETAKPKPQPAAETKAPQVAAKPSGAPQTGGGTSADEGGIGTAAIAGGAAAVAGAGGLGFWALRRRRTQA